MPNISKFIVVTYLLLASAQAELLLPNGYYSDTFSNMGLRETAELAYTIPTIEDQTDCSIKCTFLEWAFEASDIPATFCYKMTSQVGIWHMWLKVTYDGINYVYVDPTQEKTNVVITPAYSVWDWYNSSDHVECEDLPMLCNSTESVIGQDFDQILEFAWWRFGNLSILKYELTTGTKIQRA
mgnify:CR=1 FL=1